MVRLIATRGVAIEFENVNYSGHTFGDFFAQQDKSRGPGWYVFGRNSEKYGTLDTGKGAYVMLCARPAVAPRAHPHYNGRVRRGWRTKREALAVVEILNNLGYSKERIGR